MRQEYRKLCEAVEREAGKAVRTPLDFEWLAEKIEARIKDHISSSTLMRMWGYRQEVVTRQTTLDMLARYLGYADYVTFCNWAPASSDEPQSDEVIARHLHTADLLVGQRVELTWKPDRRCVIELTENGCFVVVEVEHTKLSVGDTFMCDIFIEGEPLYINSLIHEGRSPMVYVVGKKNGISFSIIH